MSKLVEELLKEQNELESIISCSEKKLLELPNGKIRVSKSGTTWQYYLREGKNPNGRYLRKEDSKLAEKIIDREYTEKLLKVCCERKKGIDKFLQVVDKYKPDRVYYSLPEAKQHCLTPVILSDEEYVSRWEELEYEGKEFPDDYPEIYSDKGERVRSKTEKIIADKLYKEGIPYRYEQPYKLKNYGVVYPDFRILDVNNRKELILEHFGMMDDMEYVGKAMKKIMLYEKNGLVLGKDLLITYETSVAPFNSRIFENMLKAYELM